MKCFQLCGLALMACSILLCGCSGQSDSTTPAGSTAPDTSTQPEAVTEEDATPDTSPSDTSEADASPSDTSEADTSQDGTTETDASQDDTTETDASPNDTSEADTSAKSIEDLLSEISQLNEQTGFRTVEELLENRESLLKVAQQVLAANPEPAGKDQAREALLTAAYGITRYDNTRKDLLESVDTLTTDILAETTEGDMAASAMFYKTMIHLNMEREVSAEDPEINKRLYAMAKDFVEKFPSDPRASAPLYMIGQNSQMDGQYDTAREVLSFLVERDPSSQYGQMAAGDLKRFELLGNPMELVGPSLDGSEVDLAQYKGKVVLVDFWATWCGPCISELPNVQEVYKKYHDKGFDVFAISFDNTKEELENFLKTNDMPWTQVFFDEEGKRGWENPLGQKYGIFSIPATFLVGRDGNVHKFNVRGEELDPAVAELLEQPVSESN